METAEKSQKKQPLMSFANNIKHLPSIKHPGPQGHEGNKHPGVFIQGNTVHALMRFAFLLAVYASG